MVGSFPNGNLLQRVFEITRSENSHAKVCCVSKKMVVKDKGKYEK